MPMKPIAPTHAAMKKRLRDDLCAKVMRSTPPTGPEYADIWMNAMVARTHVPQIDRCAPVLAELVKGVGFLVCTITARLSDEGHEEVLADVVRVAEAVREKMKASQNAQEFANDDEPGDPILDTDPIPANDGLPPELT